MGAPTVLVTGTSSGIGRAIATLLKQNHYTVIGLSKEQEGDESVSDLHYAVDFRDSESLIECCKKVAAWGEIEAIVNNAGWQVCKPITETTLEEWTSCQAINITAPFLIVRELYKCLKKPGGAIVNIASVHALASSLNIAAYATSKGALATLTRNMALEFGKDGVRANVVLPGAVDTPMLRAGLLRGHAIGSNDQERLEAFGKTHMRGYVGLPAEIAEAVLFLVDNRRSSFITGCHIVVDGGATAQLGTE